MNRHKSLLALFRATTGKTRMPIIREPSQNELYGFQRSRSRRFAFMPEEYK